MKRILASDYSMELISGDGEFKDKDFDNFAKDNGGSYAVVSIMGPQSNGKSTLLNRLFNTNFKEWHESMDMGAQTTKGLWIAKANEEPFPLVMDLEGTDSSERGENDKRFENQSALFALLFADVYLINILFMDIGKECAANRPLLKTILQVGLAMESFKTSHKKTLFFVIRDTIPFDEPKIKNSAIAKQKKNIVEIWGEVQKPKCHENTSLDEFFNVEVFPLPLYPTNEKQFVEEVAKFRQEISNSIKGGFTDSGFYTNAKTIWESIKQNQDLNIPSINVLVAFLKCDEIARENLRHFETDHEDWLAVREEVKTKFISDFGARIRSILSTLLSKYDSETIQWKADEMVNIKTEKRQYLESRAYSVVDPVYITNLSRLCSKQLQSFKTTLDAALNGEGKLNSEGELINSDSGGKKTTHHQSSVLKESCMRKFDRYVDAAKPDHERARWDASKVRQELIHDIELHISNKLSKIVQQCQNQLSNNLNPDLDRLFDAEEEITWNSVNDLLRGNINDAMNELSSEAAVLQPRLDDNMRNNMKQYARNVVKTKFKANLNMIQKLMKMRYNKIYSMKFDSYQRSNEYNSNEECSSNATKEAYRGCMKFLSTMAVLRFDETYDHVERDLLSALMDEADKGVQISDSWTGEEVPPEVTLFTPSNCKDTWEQFKQDMENDASPERQSEVTEIISSFSWTPPKWVVIALLTIGVGGLMLILRFSNLDLVLLAAVSKLDWLKIAQAAGAGVAVLGSSIELLENLQELMRNNDTEAFTSFRKKHQGIMKSLLKALKLFLRYVEGMVAQKRSISKYMASI